MIAVRYRPSFIREYEKLPKGLQEEVQEKIELFREHPRNPLLKLHKLGGRLQGRLSFSVNYQWRIVFIWEEKNVAALLAVGDHNVYK